MHICGLESGVCRKEFINQISKIMSKIEEAMRDAVKARTNWQSGNTSVVVSDGGNWVKVMLHGNLIYADSQESGECMFTLAGWNTNVTRSRLRALGIDVRGTMGENGQPYCQGKAINAKKWYKFVK